MPDNSYDIITIGAGHAGCEAALAAARMGMRTLLLTMSLDSVAQLSCNPAIGGLAKGQLVKEIDALGGEMGRVTDRASIQFRELNRSKGPAVRSPRAQVDRRLYPKLMKHAVEHTANLTIRQATATDLARDGERFNVTTLEAGTYTAAAVVVTTGTFLKGLIHIGEFTQPAGRAGEFAALHLSDALRRFGLELGRLKTGTPPRVNGRTIDFSVCEEQKGDEEVKPFSFYQPFEPYEQLPCWITYTNAQTHDVLRRSLDRAPLFSGQIKSTGPRYCPSVELKIHNFPDHERHQVFLEPEGRDTDEYYCNGLATSVPIDVQEAFMRTIPGLEQVEITRYGYAIEYDCVFPYQVGRTLETRAAPRLFLAGQINGTSGYEEAAAQGLVAGINAVLAVRGEEPFVLMRHEAYIGVLIDDLITKDIREPYRMFTSLAEHRLRLRQDNADLRLAGHGCRLELVSEEAHRRVTELQTAIDKAVTYCRGRFIEGKSLAAIICRPDMTLESLEAMDAGLREMNLAGRAREQTAIELLYTGYSDRQARIIRKVSEQEAVAIPGDFDYMGLREIKREAREKLDRIRPASLGQAARIAGVSPADIAVLMVHLKRSGKGPAGDSEKVMLGEEKEKN